MTLFHYWFTLLFFVGGKNPVRKIFSSSICHFISYLISVTQCQEKVSSYPVKTGSCSTFHWTCNTLYLDYLPPPTRCFHITRPSGSAATLTTVYFCSDRSDVSRDHLTYPNSSRIHFYGDSSLWEPSNLLSVRLSCRGLDWSEDVLTSCEIKGSWSMASLIGSRGVPAASIPLGSGGCPRRSQKQFFLHTGAK